MSEHIKTRILIISDTHGVKPKIRDQNYDLDYDTDQELSDGPLKTTPTGYRHPLPPSDVLLHCGDLTLKSTLQEYKNTFAAIREAPAKLKLVIPGNHDLSLDEAYCRKFEVNLRAHRSAAKKDVDKIIEDAKEDGVVYLTEGTHCFHLDNGARIKVYACPWTPNFGAWAFQYETEYEDGRMTVGHKFDIPDGIDVAMTHGPPRGVLDYAGMDGIRAGCDFLFGSIQKARPRIHCFGHIHEAWGAYLAKWKGDAREGARVAETVDEDASKSILKLTTFRPSRLDTVPERKAKMERVKDVSKKRGIEVDTTQGENKVETGRQTLFINAAIMDITYRPVQAPWLIDIDLPASKGIQDTDGLNLGDNRR